MRNATLASDHQKAANIKTVHPVMHGYEMHAHEIHSREMHAYEIRAMKCTLIMYTPMRCVPHKVHANEV